MYVYSINITSKKDKKKYLNITLYSLIAPRRAVKYIKTK